MSDPEQVSSYLRYAIDQLGARNAQHEFEHLCRHIARLRVSSNLLPATGPVQAGGDQGRDFETFRSYLTSELDSSTGFIARSTDKTIAFAVTIQRDDIANKILGDVAKIVSQGTHVDDVHFFASIPISTSKRHQIIEKAEQDYSVKLEIWDNFAIAEQLATADLFWVARRYLEIPNEIRLSVPDEDSDGLPQWYTQDRDRYRQSGNRPTLADLQDLTISLRFSATNDAARSDYPFWWGLVEQYLDDELPDNINKLAEYELAITTMWARADLRPADAYVRRFVERSLATENPNDLLDASILLLNAHTATYFGVTDYATAEIACANAALRERALEIAAGSENFPHRRLNALHALMHLAFHPVPVEIDEDSKSGRTGMRTLLDRVDEARGLYSPAFQEVHADEAIVDRDGGFRAWRDLNASLPLAPLFPASDLAHWIAKLTPLLIDHPDFEERTSELDRFVAERAGRSSQGDAAWERAKTLVAAGQYLKALGHCHKMLGGRWSGDDPAGGLSALLILSRLYSTLHLHLAGKQYALAAAYGAGSLGLPEVQEFIPRGLLRAAECEYKSGAWCNAVDLLDVGIASAQHYLLGGFNPEEAPEQPAGLALMAIMSCALHIPGLREKIDERLGDPLVLPVAESIGAVLAEAPLTMSIDEWSELTDSQLDGRPFSDLGPHRMIRFSAHGILWMVSGSTAYRSARALERFVANLQVVLADLSSHELVLLAGPMLVEIVVELREPAETRAPVTISSQLDRRKVTVLLTESVSTSEGGPEIADPEAVATETLAAVVLILQSVSCLPGDELLAANRIAMENGLGTKITVGRPFDELEFIDEASYGLLERGTFPSLFSPSDAVVHDGIPPTVAPGPKYSKAEAEDSIRRRYEILPPLIPLTIERLRADPQFAAVVEELRELGWRDWHILLAVHVRATNVRAAAEGLLGLPNPSDVQRERFVEIGRTPEVNELDALPPADFSTGSLRLSLIAGFPLVLQSYGLRLPGAVNEESLSRFLERRYNYFSDDVPHAAIWEGGEGTGG